MKPDDLMLPNPGYTGYKLSVLLSETVIYGLILIFVENMILNESYFFYILILIFLNFNLLEIFFFLITGTSHSSAGLGAVNHWSSFVRLSLSFCDLLLAKDTSSVQSRFSYPGNNRYKSIILLKLLLLQKCI